MKVIVITGGSSGFGLELSSTLVQKYKDADVEIVICNIDTQQPLRIVEGCVYFPCDISDLDALTEVFRKILDTYGHVDAMFNNAGTGDFVPFYDDTPRSWKKVVDVNLNAVIFGTQLAIQAMKERGGVVVNTASASGLNPITFLPVYSATKHAVVGFTKSFVDFSLPVRVCAVAPTFCDTPPIRLAASLDDRFKNYVDQFKFVDIKFVVEAMIQCLEDETLRGDVLAVRSDGTIEKTCTLDLLTNKDAW